MKNAFSHIHPDLQKIAKRVPRFTISNKNLWLIRILMRLMASSKSHDDVSIENVFIPGKKNTTIRLRIYKPKFIEAPTPVLLWIHGGGYVMGRPEQDDRCCVHYVRELGIVVVSVDYRCAPQHPFPAGLEDCYSALKWIGSRARQLGVDSRRIAVGGASAGGGLAASLVHFAVDRNEIEPIFQLLVYPMLDDRTVLRSDLDHGILWNQDSNRFGWESYLGQKCGGDDMPEYSAPARRNNLSGLPHTWIGVGTADLFYDEDMAYAQKLQDHGVRCEIYTVNGGFHGFDTFDNSIPIVQDFRKSQILAMKECFFGN